MSIQSISQHRKTRNQKPLSQEAIMVALGLVPIEYHWTLWAPEDTPQPKDIALDTRDASQIGFRTRIVLHQSDGRVESPIAAISPAYFNLLNDNQLTLAGADTLTRQYAFERLGGTPEQYEELRKITEIHENLEHAKCLPPETHVTKYHGPLGGLRDVFISTGNVPQRVDTSKFHKKNTPTLIRHGCGLEEISLALLAGVPRSLIQAASYALAKKY